MIYKRFTYIPFDGFEDNGEYIMPHTVANLLNEFYEENRKYRSQLNDLKKENEQLKEQVKQLQRWNKCLAEKRHQELSYNCSDR